jgi:hypothetical protein
LLFRKVWFYSKAPQISSGAKPHHKYVQEFVILSAKYFRKGERKDGTKASSPTHFLKRSEELCGRFPALKNQSMPKEGLPPREEQAPG